jgi:hypothetical protein
MSKARQRIMAEEEEGRATPALVALVAEVRREQRSGANNPGTAGTAE